MSSEEEGYCCQNMQYLTMNQFNYLYTTAVLLGLGRILELLAYFGRILDITAG